MPTMQTMIDAYDCFVATDSFSKNQLDTLNSRKSGSFFEVVQANENDSWIEVAKVITKVLRGEVTTVLSVSLMISILPILTRLG